MCEMFLRADDFLRNVNGILLIEYCVLDGTREPTFLSQLYYDVCMCVRLYECVIT